ISARARSGTDLPFRLTIPYSVTTYITSVRGVVTMLPSSIRATIRLARRASDELQLSSGAADLSNSRRLGARLPGEIDLRRVADRDDAVVLHYVIGQVGVIDRSRKAGGVAIEKVVHPFRARRKRVGHLVTIGGFVRAGH